MAEATTTRPSRNRRTKADAAEAATPVKATPAKKAAPAKAAPATNADERVKVPLVLEHFENTKSYSVFVPPKSSGCVGKFYAPLGTEEVKVLLIGPAE